MRHVVEIDFNTTSNAKVDRITEHSTGNNMSGLPTYDSYGGFKGFVFAQNSGQWPALANGTFRYFPAGGYKGFMSQQLSAADGSTSVFVEFNFLGTLPEYLTITFDRVCAEYASQLKITNDKNSNQLIVNNSSSYCLIDITALLIPAGAKIKIEFLRWNKPFKNIKVTNLTFSYTALFGEDILDTFTCSENLQEQNFSTVAGILEQFADIHFYDSSEVLKLYANKGFLNKNLNVRIYAIDKDEQRYLIGTYITDEWYLEDSTDVVSLNCVDVTKTFQNIQTPFIEIQDRTLYDLFEILFSYTPNVPHRYIDGATQLYCKSIVLPGSYILPDSLHSNLIKVLQVGNMRAFWFLDNVILARSY